LRLSEKTKGFSLIEVLIAIVLLAIALLALAGLMVQTTRNNSFGNNMTEASTFAQDVLERLSTRPFNSMLDGSDTITGLTDPKSCTGQQYNRNWTVRKHPTSDGIRAEIFIAVTWDDPVSHSISFTHSISDVK
jgi:type IV pilus modification protein PilV